MDLRATFQLCVLLESPWATYLFSLDLNLQWEKGMMDAALYGAVAALTQQTYVS